MTDFVIDEALPALELEVLGILGHEGRSGAQLAVGFDAGLVEGDDDHEVGGRREWRRVIVDDDDRVVALLSEGRREARSGDGGDRDVYGRAGRWCECGWRRKLDLGLINRVDEGGERPVARDDPDRLPGR